MPNWNRQRDGNRESEYTTSYGDEKQDGADYDGKSCADFHQLPGRGIEDVESLTMLHQLGLNSMSAEQSAGSTADERSESEDEDEES